MARTVHTIADRVFTIRVDPAGRLVDVTLRGFWTAADLQRFRTTLDGVPALLAAGGCPPGQHVSLFDLLQFDVQAQDVIAGLSRMVDDAVLQSRRIAVVLSSALLAMQARRAAPDYGRFSTRAEAIAWLAEG